MTAVLTSRQFDRARQLALRLTGIELFQRHCEVLARKIRRLGIDGEAGFDALLNGADLGDPEATRQFVGLLTTNFSGFFRHPRHFDLAAEHALWAVHRRGAARLWSAAAASGEEPYSLAISLIEVFQRDHPPVTILATDIDEDALTAARQGEYGETALSGLATGHRERFFNPGMKARHWRICQVVRDPVEFRRLNLTDRVWPAAGLFDVVFCRNVLMYLEVNHRYAVLERIASILASDGVLILDPTEHLGRVSPLFGPGTNGVYTRRQESCHGRRIVPAGRTPD